MGYLLPSSALLQLGKVQRDEENPKSWKFFGSETTVGNKERSDSLCAVSFVSLQCKRE